MCGAKLRVASSRAPPAGIRALHVRYSTLAPLSPSRGRPVDAPSSRPILFHPSFPPSPPCSPVRLHLTPSRPLSAWSKVSGAKCDVFHPTTAIPSHLTFPQLTVSCSSASRCLESSARRQRRQTALRRPSGSLPWNGGKAQRQPEPVVLQSATEPPAGSGEARSAAQQRGSIREWRREARGVDAPTA